MTLFRPEVLQKQRTEWMGRVLLIRPVSFAFMTGAALVITVAVAGFLVVGEYTKRVRVDGILVPDRGLIKVVAPQAGITLERPVVEGQTVKAGDTLFVLSSERLTEGTDAAAPDHRIASGAAILKTVRERQQNLKDSQARQRQLAGQQREQLANRIRDLRAELVQAERSIATQTERVASVRSQYERHQALYERHYLSEVALEQKHDECLEQQSRLDSLQRERIALARELASTRNELDQLPTKAALEQAQIDRFISELEQSEITTEAERKILVTAPQDGTVTAILAEPGQSVSTQPLLTILPKDTQLEAHLYAPSRAAGFVEPGQPVRIRYAAFPYQKFGQYDGRVLSVSRTSLAPQELPAQLANPQTSASPEPLYRIQVALASQAALAYGKPQPLTSGMQLEADVRQDTRTLLEWVLEPLYSLKGRS